MDYQKQKMITRKEAAELLHVSLITITRWTTAGKITHYSVGHRILFDPQEIIKEARKPKLEILCQ